MKRQLLKRILDDAADMRDAPAGELLAERPIPAPASVPWTVGEVPEIAPYLWRSDIPAGEPREDASGTPRPRAMTRPGNLRDPAIDTYMPPLSRLLWWVAVWYAGVAALILLAVGLFRLGGWIEKVSQ